MAAGYGIDNNAGLHFIDAELQQVVSASRAGAAAYRVEGVSNGVSESKLECFNHR